MDNCWKFFTSLTKIALTVQRSQRIINKQDNLEYWLILFLRAKRFI